MLLAVLASGLLLQDRKDFDPNAYVARLHAAKSGYDRCLFQHAKEMFHGTDTPDLERAILASCHGEFDGYVNAMGAEASPAGKAAARASLESMMPGLVHMMVQGEKACAEDVRHRNEPGHIPITCDIPADP